MARTERESHRRREEKWQKCWCCRDDQRAYRMAQASAEKLEHTGPAEKKEWPQCCLCQSRLCQKERNRAVYPQHHNVKKAFSQRTKENSARGRRNKEK